MTWTPVPRSPTAEAIYAAAEQDRAHNPERYLLDADAVCERVMTKGELSDALFADGWRAGLNSFVESAKHEGALNAVGVRVALQTAVGRLTAGARIARCPRENPGVDTPPPPIIITGGWRTGTTFLFRLLGSDPRLHAPRPAELVAPWLFAEGTPPSFTEITGPASEMLHTLNPAMAFVHPSGPELPEECVLGMGTDMRNWGFTSMFRLPSYAEWLAGEDLADSYARYREVLQLITRHDDRRLVLKAPAHTAELDHVARNFAGATVIQLHRDIATTIASGARLFAVYQSTYSDTVDPVDVGRRQADQSELWLRRTVRFRTSDLRSRVTLVDVDYRDLTTDTAGVVARVYAAAGMEPPPDLRQFIERYHKAHPSVADPHADYAPQDFGLDAAELRERFSFLSEVWEG